MRFHIASQGEAHVFKPGKAFVIDLTPGDPGVPGARLYAQWRGPGGEALAAPLSLTAGRSTRIVAPSGEAGHYDLRLWSDHPAVRLAPQEAGAPLEIGFAIVHAAQARELDVASPFGSVHSERRDPYLRGWIKTLTLDTASPSEFARRIAASQGAGLQELPLVAGPLWDSDGDAPVDDAFVDALGERYGRYLDALSAAGVQVPAWQFGLEENRGRQFEQSYYFANLERKIARLRAELAQRGMQDVLSVFSVRGFRYGDFEAFAASGAAKHYDVLGVHPYKWNDFSQPDEDGEWLATHLTRVAGIMARHGGPVRLWLTEFGIPQRGNLKPEGFFGYPARDIELMGASREQAARFLVKAHVIAAALPAVEKVFVYNYHDRDDDPRFAEDHFGLRAHHGITASGDARRFGHPKPAWTAYVNMLRQLDGLTVTGVRHERELRVYEFSPEDAADTVVVAWAPHGIAARVSPARIKDGLTAEDIISVEDLYGTPLALRDGAVPISGRPVYVRIR